MLTTTSPVGREEGPPLRSLWQPRSSLTGQRQTDRQTDREEEQSYSERHEVRQEERDLQWTPLEVSQGRGGTGHVEEQDGREEGK